MLLLCYRHLIGFFERIKRVYVSSVWERASRAPTIFALIGCGWWCAIGLEAAWGAFDADLTNFSELDDFFSGDGVRRGESDFLGVLEGLEGLSCECIYIIIICLEEIKLIFSSDNYKQFIKYSANGWMLYKNRVYPCIFHQKWTLTQDLCPKMSL